MPSKLWGQFGVLKVECMDPFRVIVHIQPAEFSLCPLVCCGAMGLLGAFGRVCGMSIASAAYARGGALVERLFFTLGKLSSK